MAVSASANSALMLEAMVNVAKNSDSFPFTTEELYDKYCGLYATTYAVGASEVQEEEDDDDEGDQEA